MVFPDHIFSGITLGFRHRRELADLLGATPSGFETAALDPARLISEGVSVLALDFDGVLAPHGADQPLDEMIIWMKHCAELFGQENLFILSNKPTVTRSAWFARHFPGIRFISGVRKKPYPDGLKKIGELSHAPPAAILMVDDRLLTGCLAAILSGARPCYIRAPYASLSANLFPELFFMLLRQTERFLVRLTPR